MTDHHDTLSAWYRDLVADRAATRYDEHICWADDCEKPIAGDGLCMMHYLRRWKRVKRDSGAVCSVADCVGVEYVRGCCRSHYKRLVEFGDAQLKRCPSCKEVKMETEFSPDRHKAGGRAQYCRPCINERSKRYYARTKPPARRRFVEISYNTAHARVTKARGRAADYGCQYCGQHAAEWAYDYADPNERRGQTKRNRIFGKGSLFSADPSHYLPLCIPCHRRLDYSVTLLRVVKTDIGCVSSHVA